MRRAAGAAGLAVVLALAAAACGTPVETAKGPPPTIAPTASASGATSPSPAATGAVQPARPTASVIEDLSLLAILPAAVDGQPVVTEDGQFEAALVDPWFTTNVAAAAFGTAVAGNDLSSAMVARPMPGVFSEAWFRDWRESYDEGACGQAGGVAGNAEAQLGGRTVYIGTCAGGLRTYHAWLEGRGLLVSAFSVGEGRYGERLMAGLRP